MSPLHMFGAISKLFKKSEAAAAPSPASRPVVTPSRTATAPAQPASKGVSRDETPGRTGLSKSVSRPGSAGQPADPSGQLSIPYASIIRLIPNELWGKLAPAGVAGYHYTISRAAALSQLSSGAVKVNFGELRRNAPAGVFINTPAEDSRLVELPLSEVLAQLHPDAYARRQDQAVIQVEADVPDVFGANGATSAPVRVMEKKEVTNTTVAPRQKSPDTAFRAQQSAPAPAPEPVAEATPISAPAAPAAPAPVHPPAPARPAYQPPPVNPAIRMPTAPPAGAVPIPKPSVPVPPNTPVIARVPTPTAPGTAAARPLPKIPTAPPTPLAPRPAAGSVPGFTPIAPIVPLAGPLAQGSFTIGLDAVAEHWPDAVRKELAQLKIPDAQLALPPIDICEGLKRGRIQYPWRTLRSWIQPTPLYSAPSPNDDVMLELPLRTLTPTFLEFIRANPVNRQTAEAENITEFFRKAEQTSGSPVDVFQSLLAAQPVQPQPALTVIPAPEFAPEPEPEPVPIPQFRPATPAAPAAPAAPVYHPPAPPPAPAPVAQPAFNPGEPAIAQGNFCLPISLVSATWPEGIQQEIAQFHLGNSRLEIPMEALDAGLRSGKIEFAWAELCAWLNPPSKAAQVSINGEQRVALPIHIIGPLFIKLRPAAARKKTAVMTDIPDLFNAAGRPLAPSAAVHDPAAPAVAPSAPAVPPAVAQVIPMATPAPAPVAVPAARPPATNVSDLFGEPGKKSWTPNEIVQRSTQLPGVAGALIALQDGLLVASSLPQNMRTEMIAAFVPQIFGRLNQYSKELGLGDASATSFTIEAGTLQIYNAGIIYFAALSKPGESLPVRDLQLIAAELSRHTK
jgi:predicted regulator of Ras-like GTPase activity (Roadblock/LC7/MglB family)